MALLLQVRRNRHIEIVPISTGCLGACTYCKTKHARGHLGSYDPSALAERVRQAAADPWVSAGWVALWQRARSLWAASQGATYIPYVGTGRSRRAPKGDAQ